MKKQAVFSIPVDGVIDAEYLVVVSYKIQPHAGRKLPVVYHGIGGMGKFVVHIAGIDENIHINSIMHLIELFHLNKRNNLGSGFDQVELQVVS